tara:strand:+ start:208 stop:441 length:234 start_codon:yes stop_codon:yes gene_type:complete
MISKTRMFSLLLIVVMLLMLVLIRQVNQVLFIHIQEINKEKRIMQHQLNASTIQYLKARRKVPAWAKKQGYVMREKK